MDIEKVRQLSDPELDAALKEAKQDLWGARFALSTRQLKDYSTIPQTRRTIARILTVQRERQGTAARAKTSGGRSRDDRSNHPGADQAEDEGRPRRQRQDGQDDRRVRRAPGAPPSLQARHRADDEVQGP